MRQVTPPAAPCQPLHRLARAPNSAVQCG
jgi:hypothetical protein